mmetsp:Transcript_27493/g.58813  ORF Transcript_27493/g.58813 Transcript_27493/m.58813 type:complete len:291 (-) Transcript_27493:610-1482(-)
MEDPGDHTDRRIVVATATATTVVLFRQRTGQDIFSGRRRRGGGREQQRKHQRYQKGPVFRARGRALAPQGPHGRDHGGAEQGFRGRSRLYPRIDERRSPSVFPGGDQRGLRGRGEGRGDPASPLAVSHRRGGGRGRRPWLRLHNNQQRKKNQLPLQERRPQHRFVHCTVPVSRPEDQRRDDLPGDVQRGHRRCRQQETGHQRVPLCHRLPERRAARDPTPHRLRADPSHDPCHRGGAMALEPGLSAWGGRNRGIRFPPAVPGICPGGAGKPAGLQRLRRDRGKLLPLMPQ